VAAAVNGGSSTACATDAAAGEAELQRLRRQRPGGAHRPAVLTLLVQVGSDDLAPILDTLRGLTDRSPCRTVVVATPSPRDQVIVGVRSVAHASGARAGYVDEIVLHLQEGAVPAPQLVATVTPWLLPGLPVVGWMPDTLPHRDGPLVALADRLLVDTERFLARPGAASLTDVVALGRHVPVTDLTWVRLEPWRELFAHLFVGAELAPFVHGVEHIEAEDRGDALPARLLAGWAASRLGLGPAAVHVAAGTRRMLRAAARDGARTATFGVVQATGDDVVVAEATVDGGPARRRTLPLDPSSPSSVLDRALATGPRHDDVWEAALVAASALRSP
jgi:glucose-6-phosphate dehydrogenase assembly protein OpcA